MLSSSMTVLVEMAAELAWPVTQALFHSLWIGAAIAACLQLIERVLRLSSSSLSGTRSALAARQRFVLSMAALSTVGVSVPFSFALVVNRPVSEDTVAAGQQAPLVEIDPSPNVLEAGPPDRILDDAPAASEFETSSGASTLATSSDAQKNSPLQRLKAQTRHFAPVVAALYGFGVLAMLVRLAIAICGGRRLTSSGRSLTDSALVDALHDQANRLGVKLLPFVAACDRVTVPVVVGVLRPVILLPASLLAGLAPEDVSTILAHELAHLRRLDHLSMLVQRGLEAVLFYHPVAWWLGRRIDTFREDACDDLVLAAGVDRIGYANTLLRVAELRTATSAKKQLLSQLAVDGGHPSKLRRRIERIVESESDPGVRVRQSRSAVACVSLVAAFILVLAQQISAVSQSEPATTAPTTTATDERDSKHRADSGDTKTTDESVLAAKLDSTIQLAAAESPLFETLDMIEKISGIRVTINLSECMLRGVNGSTPVTVAATDETVREVLKQITQQVNLTFEVTADGVRIPAKTPAFEFRIVPELPVSAARIRLSEDWKDKTYRDGTVSQRSVHQEPGFAWFPVRPVKDESFRLPAMKSRGPGQIGLLSDDREHIVSPDGRWHVKEVRLEEDPNGGKRLAVTVDEGGGARIRRLSQAAMNQKVAMLVHGVVIMAPTVRGEIGEKFVIAGGFSDEQWRLIEKSVKQAMLPAGDEFSFDCDVHDKETGKPISGARVRWIVRKTSFSSREEPLFDQSFTTDEQGQFHVTMPRDIYEFAKRTTEYAVSHPNYLGRKNVGAPLRLPDAPVGGFDLRHLRMVPGVAVTGRFIEPDGSPAVNLPIMVSRNREGPGSGFPGDVVGRTDESGRFRVVTSPSWPKRLHWYPENFVSDSRALRKATEGPDPITFGEQGTIRLKTGPRLRGRVVDLQGLPLSGVILYAATGTRVPIRYVTTDKFGEFQFPPLPPAEYGIGTADIYFDAVNDRHQSQKLSRPIERTKVVLPATGEAQSIVLRQVDSRKLTIRAFDDNFLPKADTQFHVGLPPYRDVTSVPEPDLPGTHYLWLRNGKRRHTLRATPLAGQVALWQTDPRGPAAPGHEMVLSGGHSEVVVRYRQAGSISLVVKFGDRIVPPPDRSLIVKYKRRQVFSDVGVSRPTFRFTVPGGQTEHLIHNVAPDEDVVIDVGIKGGIRRQKTVRVAAGQTAYVTIDLAKTVTNDTANTRPERAPDAPPDSAKTPPAEPAADDAATLTVKYDIPGSDDEARIFVERGGETAREIGSQGDGVRKWTPLKDGASFDLQNLSPGDYQVARMRDLELIVGNDPNDAKGAHTIFTTRFLDLHRFSLKAGQQKTIEFARRNGQRVTGIVERSEDVNPARVVLYVSSPNAENIDDLDSPDTPLFDAQQCNAGEFTTDQLEPGEYSLIAVGYNMWPSEEFLKLTFPRPEYIGRIKLIVPREGQAKMVKVPLHRIHYPPGSTTTAGDAK